MTDSLSNVFKDKTPQRDGPDRFAIGCTAILQNMHRLALNVWVCLDS